MKVTAQRCQKKFSKNVNVTWFLFVLIGNRCAIHSPWKAIVRVAATIHAGSDSFAFYQNFNWNRIF